VPLSLESRRTRYRKNHSSLNAIKRERGCIDCGTKDGRLDFDHIDPSTKSFNLACSHGWSWGRILGEVAKCEVRCASCHTRRHNRG